jgi:molybdopterin-containing oxidoreductase family iron-sulfur binding subunit
MSSVDKNNHENGRRYWRSLEQLADTPEFRKFLEREFPSSASEMNNAWSRRNFLTLMGASLALAGLTSCRRPEEKILPYVDPPEEVIPGVPEYFATTMPFGAGGYGLVVESHEGRPTKIEGNRLHPSSRGASNVFMQAAVLGLYDPDRSQHVLHKGAPSNWDNFVTFWRTQRSTHIAKNGAGLAVLSESFASPTLSRLKDEFLNTFPQATWVTYEPVSDETLMEGIKVATGGAYLPRYRFDKAEVILSLDADFLLTESENITHARDFMSGRRITSGKDSMNRLYVVEGRYSLTGATADHRLRVPSRQIGSLVLVLANELKKLGVSIPAVDNLNPVDIDSKHQHWLHVLAKDLFRTKGRCLIVAGHRQPAAVHALVFALNDALGNIENTISFITPVDKVFSSTRELQNLVTQMRAGDVSTLIILGGNPVYNAPADFDFAAALKRVEHAIHLSQYVDETSRVVGWHLPQAHFLESWGDARAHDGTLSVVQPLIAPLYGGHSSAETLQFIISGSNVPGYEIVRKTWKDILRKGDIEKKWRRVLHDGLLPDSRTPEARVRSDHRAIARTLAEHPLPTNDDGNLEIVFSVSPSVYDGRFANNGWLQELPDPVTKLTWDNPAQMSPRTAKALNVKNGDIVTLEYQGRKLEIPVWVVPGHADDSITLELGYGRTAAGQVGDGVGFNTYLVRTSSALHFGSGVKLTKTGRTHALADTQHHGSMEGRPIVREATLEEYRRNPHFAQKMVKHPPLVSLWKEPSYDEGYQWGMTIDLNACIGCGVCTIACQSENNIAVVGKEQVRKGREMHWIRVDRYYEGEVDEPKMVHQPVPCQHCENAPCEQVCPVAATVHDSEGLNVMVYNRCIGTRYCSNNCPYKVRRFNFFNYINEYSETMKMAQNPDVTVRSRGVMEKCTYCIQRINSARKKAKRENRTVADQEILTACQQACPTNAINFGNINDPDSQVVALKKQARNYHLLDELNVKPRTSYLARLRNPNPELEES